MARIGEEWRVEFEQAMGESFGACVSPPVPFEDASPHECCEVVWSVVGQNVTPKSLASLAEVQIIALSQAFGEYFGAEPPSLDQIKEAIARTLARLAYRFSRRLKARQNQADESHCFDHEKAVAMNNAIVCSNVRPAKGSGSVVEAYKDVRQRLGDVDLTNPSVIREVRDNLRVQGIVLGEKPATGQWPSVQASPAAAVQIVARDESGNERRLVADSLETISLSSGLDLYNMSVPDTVNECGWLVGRTLEIIELRD